MIGYNGLKYSINVSLYNVFKGINVYPIIIFGNKSHGSNFNEFLLNKYSDLLNRKFIKPTQLKKHKTFKDFEVKIKSGTTGFQAMQLKKIISNDPSNSSIPFVVSGNIDRYYWSNRSVRYMGNKFSTAFIKFNADIIANSKWEFWCLPKIVIAGMTKVIEAVYVEKPLGLGVGIYGIYDFGGIDPYCLTAILNSKYLTYYFLKKFKDKHLAGGYLAINKSTIEKFPLVDISIKTQNILSKLSKKIHEHKIHKKATGKIENEIDKIVFKLYNLDFNEVIEIFPGFSTNKEGYKAIEL